MEKYDKIAKEKFEFAQLSDKLGDKKLETKPVGYFKDALIRFRRNKSSVVGAVIILILVLFSIFAPIFGANNYTTNLTDTTNLEYIKLLPKCKAFAWAGWNGCQKRTVNENTYMAYKAIGQETGCTPIVKVYKDAYADAGGAGADTMYYDISYDTYYGNGMVYLTFTKEQYDDIQRWQDEHKKQIIFPAVNTSGFPVASFKNDANIWYEINSKGAPKLKDGEFVDLYRHNSVAGQDGYFSTMRIAGDDGTLRYSANTGDIDNMSYKVRIFKYTYFEYRYGFEPEFLFGTNSLGQDIFTRLASGARFSLMLAVFVSLLNLTIGTLYGAVEGYYGGIADLAMERLSDILASVPFIVVTTLFQLHLAKIVGPVVSLLFAFVLTGWIGMASTVRMQFYRYKNQEYVLAARTLGAGDGRIMFKHIFPNSLGTIVTGSVLVIPGVIFSESSLTYLGIVNLESSTMTSVGTMLANGKDFLSTFPHIILFPAIFISLLMISFNLFGNGLRDAFNPSLRGVE